MSLKISKASQQSDFPTEILIENCEYFASYFHENINHCLLESLLFPDDLKLADVTPAYKKKSKTSKDSYRPVSTLSNISKLYKRCIYDHLKIILIKFFLNSNVVFEKVSMGSSA